MPKFHLGLATAGLLAISLPVLALTSLGANAGVATDRGGPTVGGHGCLTASTRTSQGPSWT